MILRTRGIIIKRYKYGENSIIVHAYTEESGLQHFFINSIKRKKTFKQAFLQPMMPVELVYNHTRKNNLQYLKEIQSAYVFKFIPLDIQKNSMALFLAEILDHSIKEVEKNIALFRFLFDSIVSLDKCSQQELSSFHLKFLIYLSRFLGFAPLNNYSEENQIFNLQEGVFSRTVPEHQAYLMPPLSVFLYQLLRERDYSDFSIPYAQKKILLRSILQFYQMHVEKFKELKSLPVLEEIFR